MLDVDRLKRQNKYQRARREAHDDQGLCLRCGDERKEGLNGKGKPHKYCVSCYDYNNRANDIKRKDKKEAHQGKPFPITTTGKHYETSDGHVGKVVPCPCDNPLILEFTDGKRKVFFIKEIDETDAPLTKSPNRPL